MSDFRAINAVTQALKQLLIDVTSELQGDHPDPTDITLIVEDVKVTALSPEFARANKVNQVNLFLYAIAPNGAMRNLSLPPPGKAGDQQALPLPLNLSYLVTAFGRNDNDLAAHTLLGWAVRRLHDAPVLAPNLLAQTERVRITMQAVSVEELSKLWMMFKVPYCVSAAFHVDVVVIEGSRAPHAALPVLTRGERDAGFSAQGSLVPQFPTIESLVVLGTPTAPDDPPPQIEVPARQPGLVLGQTLVVRGHHLNAPVGGEVAVRFRRVGEGQSIEPLLRQEDISFREIVVPLPDVAPVGGSAWQSGVYLVSVVSRDSEGRVRESNDFPVALVPRVDTIDSPARVGPRTFVRFLVTPPVAVTQSTQLLFADQSIRGLVVVAPPELRFDITDLTGVPADKYYARVRVDGVESLLVKNYAAKNLEFDDARRVTIP